MPDLYDRTIETVELMPPDERVIHVEEIIREASEDETRSTTTKLKRSPLLWCGHYKPYGFSCSCGNRFCRSCLEEGRIAYCLECGATLGACCHDTKRKDGVFCPRHTPVIDWGAPLGQAFIGAVLLGGLAMAICVLFHIVR